MFSKKKSKDTDIQEWVNTGRVSHRHWILRRVYWKSLSIDMRSTRATHNQKAYFCMFVCRTISEPFYVSLKRHRLMGKRRPVLNLKWHQDCVRFTMGIPIPISENDGVFLSTPSPPPPPPPPPIRRQAITWNNAELMSTKNLCINFSEIWIKISRSPFRKKAFEEVVCKMAALLSRGDQLNRSPEN